MNLITLTEPQRIALEIQSITAETLSFVESQLKRLHQLANTQGQQADIMAAFGTNGVTALTAYAAFQSALTASNPNHSVPSVDLTAFQPQEDGSVIYVAQTAPEPSE